MMLMAEIISPEFEASMDLDGQGEAQAVTVDLLVGLLKRGRVVWAVTKETPEAAGQSLQ